jgi:carboxylesterase type B
MKPTNLITQGSAQANIPTWRYYYNATIANVQPPGFPSLQAFHSSELAIVFGTYNTTDATQQEIELSAFMQKAWADFTKNPEAGPGWVALNGTAEDEIACLGCNGNSGATFVLEGTLDQRCPLFKSLYTATRPAT